MSDPTDRLAAVLQNFSITENDTNTVVEKRALITSALPYVNNVPHLGNIVGSLLSADVFARFCRLRGRETLFICGTDEYGTATETKALEEKLTPEQICSKYHALHKDIYDWFNLSFDRFGRTSTPEQTELCQDIFWKLHRKGFILEDSMEQLFCESCNRFLADRFVEGTCPFCCHTDARGDQCDKCGKLINAPELKEPKCKLCKSSPQLKTSKHLFLDLPKLEPAINAWLKETTSRETCCWTQTARVISAAWLKEGLKPRCITRDMKWGTPVPLEGYEDKVFYVWFDAPIGYLSITKGLVGDKWEEWWKRPDDVELYQFMAKDNVPFHAVIMPATQIGTGDPFKLVDHLIAVEYFNYEDKKFSKSRGIGVFGNDAMESQIPADVWRFYLISVRPESADSSFSWNDIMAKNNSELLNNLGNFCNRALTFLFNHFDGVIQEITLDDKDQKLILSVNQDLEIFLDLMRKSKLRDGLRQLLKISSHGNLYMQETKPWEMIKNADDRIRAASIISLSANLVALLALLFSPFIPHSCTILRQQLNLSSEVFRGNQMTQLLKKNHRIDKPSPLFRRIEEPTIKDLKAKFAGKKVETASSDSTPYPDLVGKSMQEIEVMIKEQGDRVRLLKAAGTAKEIVSKEVDLLKFLKERKQNQK